MTAHDVFSRYVGIPLAELQRACRPSERSRFIEKRRALQFRYATLHWPQPDKEQWILERLRSAVRRASRETRFYESLFKRIGFDCESEFGFEEFSRIPVLEKVDIAKAGEDLISKSVPRGDLRPDATGGSTGVPVRIWVGPEESGWRASSQEFFFQNIGVQRGSRIANLWGHHLDPVGLDSLRQRTSNFIQNVQWFDCFRLGPEVLDSYHEQMEAFQPDCIVAYATALGAFATHLERRGIRPGYPRRCIVTGAEKLYDSQREIAERVFRKPIFERYGSRDVGGMAFQYEIPVNREYVVDWSNVLLEPEFNTKESSVLVTKFHGDGMPMIRYRIGDEAEFPDGSKPGFPVFRILSVLGRAVDKIWLPDGRFINSIFFPHMMKDFPVREFMVVQEEDYSVQVQIVPEAGFTEDSRNQIRKTVEKNLPGLPVETILVESVPRTPSNKWRPVITKAPPAKVHHNA